MLSPDQVRILVIHLVRDLDTIRAAAGVNLDDELWNKHELLEMLCWKHIREAYNKNKAVLPRLFLEAAVRKTLMTTYSFEKFDDSKLADFFHNLYDVIPNEWLNHESVIPYLEEFLLDRRTEPHLQKLASGKILTGDFAAKLDKINRASKISAVKAVDIAAFGLDIFKGMNRTITGASAIDNLMGGIRMDECIGLLGPMKGGKTSLAITITVEWIRRNHEENRNRKLVTFFTYEEGAQVQYSKFLIAYINSIPRDELQGKTFADMSSDQQNQLLAAQAILNEHLNIIDMSVDATGIGGAAEVERCIDQLHKENQLGDIIIIDHARQMASRRIAGNNLPVDQMRHEVSNICSEFKRITSKYNIAGFLLHQMDAEGNKASKMPSHMNASECKLFPELLHHTICLGIPDHEKNVSILNLSASRSLKPHHTWVTIKGQYHRVEATTEHYVDRNGRLLSQDEQQHGRSVQDAEQLSAECGPGTVAYD